jgi:MFS family permease
MFSRGRRVSHRLRLPFTRLWVGSTLASSGDGLALGAVPLLAVVVDPHPIAVSAVAASDSLPWLLVALPAGAFADRFERGPVMALANMVRAIVMLSAAVLIVSGHMTLWLLILIVLVSASGRAIYYSSYQSLVPELVESERLERANGILSGTEAATEHLAGPVVGTSLFAATQSVPFFSEAVAFVLSCLPLVRFRTESPRPTAGSSTSIWEGARLLWGDRRLRVLLLLVASLAGLQGMESGVLVLLATKVWGIRTAAYGLLLAVGAAGNLGGSFGADRLVRRFGSARTLFVTAVFSGIAYLLMALANGWSLAGPAALLLGLAVGAGSVIAISLRQRMTPPDLMGRVGGAWRGMVWGAAPVGAIAAGSLAALGGLRLPIALAGVLQIAVAVVLARPLFRSIRTGIGPQPSTPGEPGGTDQDIPAPDDGTSA